MNKGFNKFGKNGHNAPHKESHQTHNRMVTDPVNENSLTPGEQKTAMKILIFLTDKRDGRTKGRTCVNGSTQRSRTSKDEASSPKDATESMLLNAAMQAKEERDAMTIDVPNAFRQKV